MLDARLATFSRIRRFMAGITMPAMLSKARAAIGHDAARTLQRARTALFQSVKRQHPRVAGPRPTPRLGQVPRFLEIRERQVGLIG